METNQKIMVALGGNALGSTPKEQLKLVRIAAKAIADLVEDGNKVVIAHGNGPQVGMINLGLSAGYEAGKIKAPMPFPECGAMSEGYIGYHLQNALHNEFKKRGIERCPATVVTQIIVDENDPAFKNPSKPIGAFYTKEQAEKLAAEDGGVYKEDANRGYRKVVASPKPVFVVEKDAIENLVNNRNVVIAAGGCGIPVVERNGELFGVDAVIDKDFAAEKLAELLDCDTLLILTAVDKAAINFGKPNQESISEADIKTIDRYIAEGHFASGSMLPKIEAARKFAVSGKGRRCIITSLEKAVDGFYGKDGTCISE